MDKQAFTWFHKYNLVLVRNQWQIALLGIAVFQIAFWWLCACMLGFHCSAVIFIVSNIICSICLGIPHSPRYTWRMQPEFAEANQRRYPATLSRLVATATRVETTKMRLAGPELGFKWQGLPARHCALRYNQHRSPTFSDDLRGGILQLALWRSSRALNETAALNRFILRLKLLTVQRHEENVKDQTWSFLGSWKQNWLPGSLAACCHWIFSETLAHRQRSRKPLPFAFTHGLRTCSSTVHVRAWELWRWDIDRL